MLRVSTPLTPLPPLPEGVGQQRTFAAMQPCSLAGRRPGVRSSSRKPKQNTEVPLPVDELVTRRWKITSAISMATTRFEEAMRRAIGLSGCRVAGGSGFKIQD